MTQLPNDVSNAVTRSDCAMMIVETLEKLRLLLYPRNLQNCFETSLTATIPLSSIFNLCFLHGLPLHVRRHVGPAAFQRHDVIHNITLASSGVAGLLHEFVSGGRTALNLAIAGSLGDRGSIWN